MSSVSALHQNSGIQTFRRDTRLGAVAGWVSTAAWLVLGADSIVRPAQDNRRDIFWWLPFGLLVFTLVAVHRLQRYKDSRFELSSYCAVAFASALALLGNLGVILGNSLLATLGFPGGAIIFTLGLIAFGVATWRANVFPPYVAWALILWEPGSVATGLLLSPIAPLHNRGAYSAGLWKGLATALITLGLQKITSRK